MYESIAEPRLLPFLDLLIKTVESGTGKLTEQGIQEEVDNFIQAVIQIYMFIY